MIALLIAMLQDLVAKNSVSEYDLSQEDSSRNSQIDQASEIADLQPLSNREDAVVEGEPIDYLDNAIAPGLSMTHRFYVVC